MKVELYVYTPGVAEPKTVEAEFKSGEPTLRELRAVFCPLIGGNCSLEHVTVLFNGKRADMFVDEMGIARGLPPNAAATEIYHAAAKAQGRHAPDAPLIYGVAVLASRRIWF